MEDLKGKAGIYKIENLVNGKVYIGSSVCLDKRKQNHFIQLKNSNHDNSYLQRACNKYGIDNLKFIVIEFIDKIDDKKALKEIILDREQYWTNEMRALERQYGYNLATKANSMLGYKHSEESKKRMSIAKIGKKHSKEAKIKIGNASRGDKNFWYGKTYGDAVKARRVINLTTGKIYDSIKRACEECGMRYSSNVISVCQGDTKTAGGFMWAYLDEYNNPMPTGYINTNTRSVINIDTMEIFESIALAARTYSVVEGSISNNVRGSTKTSGGYHWQYYEDYLKEHPEDTDSAGE